MQLLEFEYVKTPERKTSQILVNVQFQQYNS